MRREITNRLLVLATLFSVFGSQVAAQTPAQVAAAEAQAKAEARATAAQEVLQKKIVTTPRVNGIRRRPVVIQNGTSAPQVVTILHGLNWLKLFRMLVRSNERAAIAKLDKTFQIENEIHTNVIAGLALDDGRTIAVWLPEAEAELLPMSFPYAPVAPSAPGNFHTPKAPEAPEGLMPSPKGVPPPHSPTAMPGLPPFPFTGSLLQPSDLKVVTREGKRLKARYIGLDGLTGLSVITLANDSLPSPVETKEETITVGQRLRLVGPEPASQSTSNANPALYVRIGETEATVVKVSRARSGAVHRVRVKSARLTPANMGGIAINDAGETLGIIDAVHGSEATIVPLALVRNAVKRVMDRQASVPRPWLGIKGEPIGELSFERIQREGWELDRARSLAGKREGIMLTSVIPGSPAALANLRPGDVILRVNNDEVRNAEEFTWLMDAAGPGGSLKFTVARPEKLVSEALEIKLGESPDLSFGFRMFAPSKHKVRTPGSLSSRGVETITLRPQAAAPLGANGGLLVVHVQPSSEAFKAGLKPGDVIEAINGQPVRSRPVPTTLFDNADATSTFNIVRNKQKLVITIQTH